MATQPKKRGYSYEFTPNKETEKAYSLRYIPAPLWRRFTDKCRREGLSYRAAILRLLQDWSAS
jgi:hypothetical protein